MERESENKGGRKGKSKQILMKTKVKVEDNKNEREWKMNTREDHLLKEDVTKLE